MIVFILLLIIIVSYFVIKAVNKKKGTDENQDKSNKKWLKILIVTIILVVGLLTLSILITNINKLTGQGNVKTPADIGQDFKYVQEDNNSFCGKSFKNVDFKTFKNNVRELWFKNDLEYDMIMARNKAVFGEEYSNWQMYNDSSTGGYMEEIKFPYLKGNSYIIGKMVDIYYNNDKTTVYSIAIYISDYYLGKVGRSKLWEEIDEVINCLPADFKEEVNKRIDSNINYEDFNVGYYENVKLKGNEEYHMVNILCEEE